MLRILAITSELPYPPSYGGARLRQFELLRRLNQKHEVHLVTYWENEEDKALNSELEPYLSSVSAIMKPPAKAVSQFKDRFKAKYWRLTWSEEMRELIKNRIKEVSPDVVYVSPTHMAFYKSEFTSIPAWLDLTDSGVLHTRSDLKVAKGFKAKFRERLKLSVICQFEKEWASQYDACSFVAKPDADQLKNQIPNKSIHIIENGVDTDYFKPFENIQKKHRLVFTGTMDFAPNIDAVSWFCSDIFPILKVKNPDLVFDIVGRVPTQDVKKLANIEGVNVHGYVEDLRKTVQQASVYVCPIRRGAGLKNKILEAMAMEMPIVSTQAGATGMSVQDGSEMKIQDSETGFANAVEELLKNTHTSEKMGQKGREYVLNNYSWDKASAMLGKELCKLIKPSD